jgi:tetratricopeptide (TPR) repeat protein
MKFRFLILVAISIAFILPADAQKGVEDGSRYGHGEDSIRCIRNLSLYREYAKNDNYDRAIPFWRIVFQECPRSSKNIYIDGPKMYREFIKNTNNPVREQEMIDTLMLIYDKRMKYYQDSGNVLGRKAIDLLRFRRDDVEYIKEAYGYLKQSIEIDKKESSYAVLATFMTSGITLYKADELNAEQVIKDYATVTEIMDHLISKRPNSRTLNNLKETIDDNFIESGAASCDQLVDLYRPRYDQDPENVELLKKITIFLEQSGCADTELFFEASASLHNQEPSSLSAANLARMSVEKDNFQAAYDYFKQAIEMETDEEKKADLYYSTGIVARNLDRYSEARDYAYKALDIRPEWGEPYILIGNLYANSKNQCSDIELPNAIYWAAVDKFVKAKQVDASVEDRANDLIQTYAGYFPNKEEAFFLEVLEGSSYTVGCWINETTRARF